MKTPNYCITRITRRVSCTNFIENRISRTFNLMIFRTNSIYSYKYLTIGEVADFFTKKYVYCKFNEDF